MATNTHAPFYPAFLAAARTQLSCHEPPGWLPGGYHVDDEVIITVDEILATRVQLSIGRWQGTVAGPSHPPDHHPHGELTVHVTTPDGVRAVTLWRQQVEGAAGAPTST